jgi:DNA-binding PadR family transcriptional regulator
MESRDASSMSSFEYHVLLALASGPLHGYAIKDVVAAESAGTLTPRAGSLYRVLARLMTAGYLTDAEPASSPTHPGLARKYYGLTPGGRAALAAEARRLKNTAAVAERRLGVVRSRS